VASYPENSYFENFCFRLFPWQFYILVLLLTSGCAFNPSDAFKRVKKGQEKDDVIDIMGAPHRTARKKGQDHWTYNYTDERSINVDQEVHFEDGLAVYVGPAPQPEVSAEEQDALNERANIAVEAQRATERTSAVEEYEQYERRLKSPKEAKPLPTFKEIQ